MKKKILKTVAVIISIVLIVGVCVIANAFVGNPISKHIATNTAEKHLEEKYSDRDFEIEKVIYNLKDGNYHAFIKSPSSIDSHFTVLIDMWGNLKIDNYEDSVLTGWNTANRLGNVYREKVDEILDSQSFPYAVDIGFGDIEFIPTEYANDSSVADYAIIIEDLKLDGEYDINELGSKAGKLTIYIDDETVSYEHLAEVILEVKKIFDDAKVKFYALDFVLEYPKDENGTIKEGRVEVRDFLYADIYEEDMIERVKASDKAANEYYAEQDAEKHLDEQK
ncbi:MAG: DUF3139 domain-containing protein [Lachnospiraceae bacterium]|nr:DUF3139 domain-containing protein [Lachnospiraceae bacterium]